MSEETIKFDIEKSRQAEARIRAIAEHCRMAINALEIEVRGIPKWWKGISVIPFMRRMDELIYLGRKIVEIFESYADKFALARREKEEVEAASKAMLDAELNMMYATATLLAAGRTAIDAAIANPELAVAVDSHSHWNVLQEWEEKASMSWRTCKRSCRSGLIESSRKRWHFLCRRLMTGV